MEKLEIVSKKTIVANCAYEFNGHKIECTEWTERGKNGSNTPAYFVGKIDGNEFKGSVTDLKRKVGANVEEKAKQGTPEQIFEAYLTNMRQIKNLPSYYIVALDRLTDLVKEEKAKAEAEAAENRKAALIAELAAMGVKVAEPKKGSRKSK